jgi:hypothetical protein
MRASADDFEVTKLLGANIHQQVFTFRIVAIKTLNGILHGGSKLAVCPAELLQQHGAKPRIRHPDIYRVHQLFYMMVHNFLSLSSCK